jgi:ribosome-associated toxin RatA of RatAB toxin-antitoxin module
VKRLQGSGEVEVSAAPPQCFALLEAVEHYPDWYPEVVRRVEVLERDGDGTASRAHATLHAAVGPLVKDFDLLLAVAAEPLTAVTLTRIPHGRADEEEFRVRWRVLAGPRTRIELRLDANLSVPRLAPVGGLGDSLAKGFVAAAARTLAR